MSDARWVSVPDASRILGISERQLYRRVKAGDIRSTKQGGRIHVLVTDNMPAPDEKSDAAAEVVRLKQQLTDVTEERNYLRQALALSMQNVTQLIEAGEQHKTEAPPAATDRPPPPADDREPPRWNWRRWPWSK